MTALSISYDPETTGFGLKDLIPNLSISIPRLRRRAGSGTKNADVPKVSEKEMSESNFTTSDVSLHDLRNNPPGSWEQAYRELWRVGWLTARRKLPYDSKEQLEDLLSQVIGKEIVPQIIAPKQEAFVKAMTFNDILNLTSRIMANRAIDEIRRRTRRPESSNIEKVPEGKFAIEADDEKSGRAEEVHLALAELDDRYREIVEDFYFEELSTEEIARKRGRPKGSICSDLVKARQMLGTAIAAQSNSAPSQ